jgi:anti-anti-sigma factor
VLHELHFDESPEHVVARLTGEIDSSNASSVEESLREHSTGRRLVLDLGDLRYLDSAGIAMVDALRRSCDLHLVLPSGSIVTRALTMTGVDQLVPVHASGADAVAAD